jgi:hypothetical protein
MITKNSNLLEEKEWILLQINEGPCSQGCKFCYEKPFTIKKILEAENDPASIYEKKQFLEEMSTQTLYDYVMCKKDLLGLSMPLEEINKYFRIIKQAGIHRAGLTGSQPTEHENFKQILDMANVHRLNLRIYTVDKYINRLNHPSIKNIILHVDPKRKIFDKIYMEKVNRLIALGKKIDLRVNFENHNIEKKSIIYNFYNALPTKSIEKVLLKYSFTVKVPGTHNIFYATPQSLKRHSETLLKFIDEFSEKFPSANMYAERPLFPCSFDKNIWDKYKTKGGFTTKCDSEFTIYTGGILNFCPPARTLGDSCIINSANDFKKRILELKHKRDQVVKIPSFEECKECHLEKETLCHGGCLQYKVNNLETAAV